MEFIFAGAAIEVSLPVSAVENIVATPAGEGVVTAVAKESVGAVGAGDIVVSGVGPLSIFTHLKPFVALSELYDLSKRKIDADAEVQSSMCFMQNMGKSAPP